MRAPIFSKQIIYCFNAASSAESNQNSSPEDAADSADRARFDDVDARGLRFNNADPDKRSRPRFGEPVPDREEEFAGVIRGIYAKVGAAPSGVIAESGRIVMVDCAPFTGQTRIPAMLAATYRQGGDVAALAQPWRIGDATVLVRRQSGTDAPDTFSGPLEMFVVQTTCMPESHILSASWVNVLSGYYSNNPINGKLPVIVTWTSNRRGVPAETDAAPFNTYLEDLPGPISRLDRIFADVESFAPHVTADQMVKIRSQFAAPQETAGFEGVIVDFKLDHTASNPLVVFVTLWRHVFDLRSKDLAEYKRALLANSVHRGFYDFERSLFDMHATVDDFDSAQDIVNADQLARDYVSNATLISI